MQRKYNCVVIDFADIQYASIATKTENALAFVNNVDLRSATTNDTGRFIEDFVQTTKRVIISEKDKEKRSDKPKD